jgi:glycosyltransferase involved in cell wall biosynthesis
MGLLRHGNSAMRAMAGRFHPEIPASKVVSFNARAIGDAFADRLHRRDIEQTYLNYLRIGETFDRSVVRDLQQRRAINPSKDAFFGYNTGSLTSIQFCGDQGIPTVLNQIDPAKVEEDIVRREAEKWPGWEQMPGRIPQAYWDHMKAEWSAADVVAVNSEWSKQALIQQGVAAGKILVAPLTYEPEEKLTAVPTRAKTGPVIFLWLSTLSLRKGIQYLISAAKLLKSGNIRIVVAGSSQISTEAIESAPQNMQFIGRVVREETGRVYRKADVFVLPTLSDGFAITQVEAMAHGLPVITTPNCGRVVTDGVDGLIVPAGDAAALAAAMEKLAADRALLETMSERALIRSRDFAIPNQVLRIEEGIGQPLPAR